MIIFDHLGEQSKKNLVESKISLTEKTEIFLDFFAKRGGSHPIQKGFSRKLGIISKKSDIYAKPHFFLLEPLWAKNPKNSEFFSVNRNFGFGKTPAPPFRIFSEKNQFFLNDASP